MNNRRTKRRRGAVSGALLLLLLAVDCAGRDIQRLKISHDGRDRQVLLHVPAVVREGRLGRVPLILVLHGGGGNPRNMLRMTRGRFNSLADKEGFLVAYPAGVDRGWNDGRRAVDSTAVRENIDDVGFFRDLIARLIREYPVDPRRVFATGISNGGFMSVRLACDLSGIVRAVAPVTAQLSEDLARTCRPRAPVGMLIINGTADPLVPYAGGEVQALRKKRGRILSTDASIERFRRFNGCRGAGHSRALDDRDPDDGTRALRTDFDCPGSGRVSLIRVEGGGHTWPGGRQYLPAGIVGRTSRDFDATVVIRDFFFGRDQ